MYGGRQQLENTCTFHYLALGRHPGATGLVTTTKEEEEGYNIWQTYYQIMKVLKCEMHVRQHISMINMQNHISVQKIYIYIILQ